MKDLIKDIILSFKREFQHLSPLPRLLKVPVHLSTDKAITIYGPRRAGKTYYLFWLIKQQLEANGWKIMRPFFRSINCIIF